jgi:hypothetical protein
MNSDEKIAWLLSKMRLVDPLSSAVAVEDVWNGQMREIAAVEMVARDQLLVAAVVKRSTEIAAPETEALAMPTIHLNGSSAEYLLEAYNAAALALIKASDLLSATNPNARDYYLDASGKDFERAQQQHVSRLRRVVAVSNEIQQIAAHVVR